jgi:transcriptional regulator of NAD metabolism
MTIPTPSEERRTRLVSALRGADRPMTGAELSQRLGVSRQAIVNDVAILRAGGEPIVGSPRGYLIGENGSAGGILATIASRHDPEGARRESEILVDRGISVLDVVVEHPLYGEVQANLTIDSRADIERSMDLLMADDAQPLSTITQGVHLHHVRTPNADALEAAKRELAAEGFLLQDD